MKLLYIDRQSLQTAIRKSTLETQPGIDIDLIHTKEEFDSCFSRGVYAVVILDHTIDGGRQIVKVIFDADPAQPLLIVSSDPACVVPSCRECVEMHHVRRLSNPTPIRNIIRMIGDFEHYDCDHFEKVACFIDPEK